MDSIQKKIAIIVVLGFIQIIVINVLFWTNDMTVEAMGHRVSAIGNKNLIITTPSGMVYVDHEDSLKRYETEGLVFVLKGDSNHPEMPTLYAEIWIMGELNSLEKLSNFISEDSEVEILFNRIQGSSLNVIVLDGISVNDSAFTYIRFMSAYPYFLKLNCSYEGTMWPSEEVKEILKSVRLE